jgi:hypothetical protein
MRGSRGELRELRELREQGELRGRRESCRATTNYH